MLLVRLNVFSIKQMVAFRPYFVVISFIVAAIVTPPDVVSQFMLALPLCILFQFGILLSKYTLSKSKADQSSTQ
jgi:sec-independent protein translocase protein TatC